MHKYRVAERWSDDRRLTLQCSAGRYHVARVMSVLPEVDATLEGFKPHLGFGMLVCRRSGAMYRLIFEAINKAKLPPAKGPTLADVTLALSC